MRPVNRLVTAVAALIALVVILLGIPLALIILVGWPIPDPLPTTTELGDMLAGRVPVPTDLVISALALVMWVLWAQLAWAAAVEIVATFRGRLARRAPVLPGIQLTVAKLVTAATLLSTTLTPKSAPAGALLPVAAVHQVETSLGAGFTPVVDTSGSTVTQSNGAEVTAYTTEPGDTWWHIAETTFGSGTRWKEIRNLNLGRTMDDGHVITVGTDLLRPDWRLLLPAGGSATGRSLEGGGAVGAGLTQAGSSTAETDREVVVAPGDTLWDLAEADLAVATDSPSMSEVALHTSDMADLNVDQIGDNPDLIHPGQRLELPPRPALAPRNPVTTPTAPETTEESSDAVADPDVDDAAETTETTEDAGGAETDTGADVQDQASTEAVEGEDAAAEAAEAPVEIIVSDGPIEPLEVEVSAPEPEPASSADDTSPEDLEAGSEASPPAGADGEAEAAASPGSTTADVQPTSPLAGVEASTPVGPVDVPPSASTPTAPPRPPSPPAESSIAIDRDAPTSVSTQFAEDLARRASERAELGQVPDLPTAASVEVAAPSIGEAPDGESGLDTAESRVPVFVGLAGLTLIGGYLHRARRRRRKAVLQSRHAGRRPAPTKRRGRAVARRMAAAAELEHTEFLNLGLRALGRLLADWSPESLPRVSGVWLSHNRLVLALADDSPRRTPPAPFTPFADGSGWSLLRSRADEIRTIARGANGPLPLLTSVGTTSALDLALTTNSRGPAEAYGLTSSLLFAVDLEAGRVISVVDGSEGDRGRLFDGPPASVMETMTMMAIELATSETADQAEIICVGFGHRLATFERVTVVDRLSDVIDDLEAVADRALYASREASPFATRVGNGPADTWNPVIVFHADPADLDAPALVDLAERSEGGVTAVCGYPNPTGWAFVVDGDRIRCPELPGHLARHQFERPDPGDLEAVTDLFADPVGEVELDDRFWAPLRPAGRSGRGRPDEDRPDEDRLDEVDDLDLEPSAEERGSSHTGEDAWDRYRAELQDRSASSHRSWHAMPAVNDTPGQANRGTNGVPEPVPASLRHSVEVPSVERAPSEPPPQPARPPAPEPPLIDPFPDSTEISPVGAATGPRLYVVGRPRPEPSPETSTEAERRSGDDADDEPSEDGVELRVKVLGNFAIDGHHVADRSKPWKYTKTAELILYLLLNPEGASQDLLMEQLFPEQPPNRPRLNQLVSDARTKALGRSRSGDYHLPHASPTDPFYRLGPTVGCDLIDFTDHCLLAREADDPETEMQEWRAALELVTGRPFTLPHDGYEWAVPEIEATVVKVEEAAMALADLAIGQGNHELAVWATKKGLLTGTGYYELLAKRGRAALLLEDPEEIVRAFADLQLNLDSSGAPEEGTPDLSGHPDLEGIYRDLSSGGRGRDTPT